jgi:hypothetical protein
MHADKVRAIAAIVAKMIARRSGVAFLRARLIYRRAGRWISAGQTSLAFSMGLFA